METAYSFAFPALVWQLFPFCSHGGVQCRDGNVVRDLRWSEIYGIRTIISMDLVDLVYIMSRVELYML